jgi:large subunit ribosomal protein L6
MSRLGKRELPIPPGVTVSMDGQVLHVSGPKGELKLSIREIVEIIVEEKIVKLKAKEDSIFARALWGTYSSHIFNMLKGVTEGFSKQLIIEGTGYKVEISGETLKLSLGFSHVIEVSVPKDLKVEVEKNKVTISGIDKELVGRFAAEVRSKKKPEPYKGKGVRYSDEIVERKQGKRTVA